MVQKVGKKVLLKTKDSSQTKTIVSKGDKNFNGSLAANLEQAGVSEEEEDLEVDPVLPPQKRTKNPRQYQG